MYSAPLSDQYGQRGYSLDAFMSRQGIQDDLEAINDELNNNAYFSYYQITEPSIYYVGNYRGSDETIVGGSSCRNQQDIDTGELITSLNSMEIPANLSTQMDKQITEGKAFTKADFALTYQDEIPAIVGSEYKDFLRVGDSIRMRYYLKEVDVRIIGILESGAALTLPSISMELDGYIVFPDIGIPVLPSESKDSVTQKNDVIMLLEKNEGYIGISDLSAWPEAIEELWNIRSKYDFAINVENLESLYTYLKDQDSRSENSRNEMTYIGNTLSGPQQGLVILIILVGWICLFLCLRHMGLSVGKLKGENVMAHKIRCVTMTAGQIAGAYLISYVICAVGFQMMYEDFRREFIRYPQSWVRLLLLIWIIVSGVYLSNSNFAHKF